MPYNISYNSDLRILEVTIQGKYVLTEAKQLLIEAAKAVKEYNCFILLADVRNVELDLSVLELHGAPKLFSEAFSALDISAHRLKRAVVLSKETPDFKFLETVVDNRGQMMRLFSDIDEAKKWLLAK